MVNERVEDEAHTLNSGRKPFRREDIIYSDGRNIGEKAPPWKAALPEGRICIIHIHARISDLGSAVFHGGASPHDKRILLRKPCWTRVFRRPLESARKGLHPQRSSLPGADSIIVTIRMTE